MDVADDAEGPLDPRIQIELENLNTATDDINKLEIELDEAHTAFNKLLTDSTRQLKEIANKLGSNCIEKSRCYYEAVEVARRAQVQCQLQAHLFQRASEIHAAAKETVTLAEARFMSHRNEWNFDQAWQDMLNHATIKVMDAENQKAECGREHHRKATLFHDAEKKVQQLEDKHRRMIIKARPYFELLSHCDQKLATQKERVECLKKAVKDAKQAYSKSFRTLEDISNQIHQQRRDYDIMVNGPREPGVGAELISPEDSLNYEIELNKVTSSRLHSTASSEPDTEDRAQDFEDVLELKQRMENLSGRSVDGSESKSSQWELELQASMEKLNNLTNNSNWQSDKENSSSDDCKNMNENEDIPSTSTFNTYLSQKPFKNDNNGLKKIPMDFQILKKVAFITSGNSPGWQSLTQSPINTIFNKSKIAIKNSLSKSLSNSPVNISLNFVKSKIEEAQSQHPHPDNRQSNENRQIVNTSSECNFNVSNYNQKHLVENTDASNHQSIEKNHCSLSENSVPMKVEKNPCLKINSTSIKSKSSINPSETLNSSLATQNFVKNPEFKEPNYKTSSVKELPLLSIFEKSSKLSELSRDKSCSLINLVEKRNLKSLLDNSELGNIQAVSVERLANARQNLFSRHSDHE